MTNIPKFSNLPFYKYSAQVTWPSQVRAGCLLVKAFLLIDKCQCASHQSVPQVRLLPSPPLVSLLPLIRGDGRACVQAWEGVDVFVVSVRVMFFYQHRISFICFFTPKETVGIKQKK